MNNDAEYEFQHVEFIRNPRIEGKSDAKFIAFDYFNYIYSERVYSLNKCMSSKNSIPCEAHQSIGIFRKLKDTNPFGDDQKNPFIGILQVTLMPQYYRYYSANTSDCNPLGLISEAKDELEKCFQSVYKKAQAENDFEATLDIYDSVNSMDFCLVIRTNYLEFLSVLSYSIRQIRIEQYLKYAVYATVGVTRGFTFTDKIKGLFSSKTALVVRMSLNSKFFLSKKDAFMKENIDVDVHTLPGRYDLSFRVDYTSSIFSVMEALINYYCPISEDYNIFDTAIDDKTCKAILWLLSNECIDCLNVRVLFDSAKCIPIGEFLPIKETDISFSNHVESVNRKLEEVKRAIVDVAGKEESFSAMLNKIENIVSIFSALDTRYDTKISTIMLGEYLISFLSVLAMYLKLANQGAVAIEDITIHLVQSINYIQQYMKVVTSVNSNSYESPKYETENGEGNIVKFAIAYSWFIDNAFDEYYNKRKCHNDSEFPYFPRYRALIIPFMLNNVNDFMMTTLFSQGLSDDWRIEREEWKAYIGNDDDSIKNDTPMYIICPNMEKYKDVSSVIISSLHEMGHYCNGMTRKQRNVDLVYIYCEEIAKTIVKKWISLKSKGIDISQYVLRSSRVTQILYESIYDEISKYIKMHFLMDEEDANEIVATSPCNVFQQEFERFINGITINLSGNYSSSFLEDWLVSDLIDEFEFITGEKILKTKNIFETICQLLDKSMDKMKELLTQETSVIEGSERIISCIEKETEIDISGNLWEKWKAYGTKIKEVRENVSNIFNYCSDKLLCSELKILINVQYSAMDTWEKMLLWSDQKADELYNFQKLKTELVENIYKSYFAKVSSNYPNTERRLFLQLYRDMYISPDSKADEFKNILSSVLTGLNFESNALELAGNCYFESVADFVMCENLGITASEYIADMAEIYTHNDASNTAARLIIVISYLMCKDKPDFFSIKDDRDKYNYAVNNFRDQYTYVLKELEESGKDNINKILDILSTNYENVLGSKLFKVAFKRILECANKVQFLSHKENYKFVKERIKQKIIDEQQACSAEEIQFILYNYYKNRFYYAGR